MPNTTEIIDLLEKNYPNAKYYLNFSTPLDLLVSAILSAQCRDEVVNKTTEKLFKKYKTVEDYANSRLEELEKDIKEITFFKNKARNIKETCKILAENYNGKIPKKLEELEKLPGIGRKTAIAILTNAFDIVEGIVVDTHVIRVANRLSLTNNKNADKIEKDLMEKIPREKWKKVQWLFKAHGKAICKPKIPKCSECFLNKICPKKGVQKFE